MEPDFSWIFFVLFLIIPLARIIPRLLNRRKMKENYSQTITQKPSDSTYADLNPQPQRESTKPRTKSMLVLGELNRGTRIFDKLQKNTGIENIELETILDDLESRKMIEVRHVSGLFGKKIELHSTEKGFKEYYS